MRSPVTHPAPLLAAVLAVTLLLPLRTAGACPASAESATKAGAAASRSCETPAATAASHEARAAACAADAKSAAACPAMAGCCAKQATTAAAKAETKKGRTRAAKAARAARAEKAAPAAPASAAAKAPAAAPASAGMRVSIDPESGALVPAGPGALPEESSAVTGAPVFEAVRLPDGSLMIDLQDQLHEYVVLQFDAQGRRVVRCTPDPVRAMSVTPAPAPQPEER